VVKDAKPTMRLANLRFGSILLKKSVLGAG
jgi:hypothetical protein